MGFAQIGASERGAKLQADAARASAAAQQSGNSCFAENTPIIMENGEEKMIQDIKLGERIKDGGRVHTLHTALVADIFSYRGILVSGKHPVKEGGVWMRISDSKLALPVIGEYQVYCLGTENFIIPVQGVIFSDFFENKLYGMITDEESIRYLNLMEQGNGIRSII